MLLSVLDLVYEDPFFASPGTPIPNKNGFINFRLNGHIRHASSYRFIVENGRKQCIKDSYSCSFSYERHILHKVICDKLGALTKVVTYKYNENSQIAEILCIDACGKQCFRNLYRYNKKNLLCTDKSYDEKDNLRGEHEYLYDPHNNVKEHRWESVNPEYSWKLLYTYDENNQEIEMREYKGVYNVYERRLVKTYDSFGNIINHVSIDSNGKETELAAGDYDEFGRCGVYRHSKYSFELIKYDNSNKVVEIAPNPTQIIKVLYNESKSITVLWMEKESLVISRKREICFDEHDNIISIINYTGENLENIEGTLYSYEYYPM